MRVLWSAVLLLAGWGFSGFIGCACAVNAAEAQGATEAAAFAPPDTRLALVADLPAIFSSQLFNSLLGDEDLQMAQDRLEGLREGGGLDYRRDLRRLYLFASSDHLATATLLVSGRFDRGRLDHFLRVYRRAGVEQHRGRSLYQLRRERGRWHGALYLVFPREDLLLVTFARERLELQLDIIEGRKPGVAATALAQWYAPPPGAQVYMAVSDLGMFVGGQQPFALAGRSIFAVEEKAGALAARFVTELPDEQAANQLVLLLGGMKQLAANYPRDSKLGEAARLLEGVRMSAEGKVASVALAGPVRELAGVLAECLR